MKMLQCLSWYFPPLYLKLRFWVNHKQRESHPCIHLHISRVEPPPRVPLPSQGSGERCLTGVRPLRQQQQLCPSRTCIPPPMSLHWCQPGAAKTHGLHQKTPCWPLKLTYQTEEALKLLPFSPLWKKICSKNQENPGSKKKYSIMLFHAFNFGGIMTKSKQNPLVLLPQGTPKALASGQRKELAAGKLFWQNSARFWKLQGMALTSFSCRCLAWQMISESEFLFYLQGILEGIIVWESTWGGAERAGLYGNAKAKHEQQSWAKAWSAWGNQPGAS